MVEDFLFGSTRSACMDYCDYIAATFVTFQLCCRDVTMLLRYRCNDLRYMDVYERC